ncbi:hypothetical protein CAPTEDRAFT_186743 [Capitella teleta]|uniref:Reverse transcriptase domain-containing protein n=1 Tax=Capitella teleta TaxID=283909 RepID=R7VFJ4_CAPTE|nr:hypothetical protein CAPTEDRAFT_186743 [Capitella teleta]|eukprot:ELU15071.1 hypothetical protein CAPTEDRAFT_186743 [Capitella teleta]
MCGNYRGISLVDSLTKLYDIILNRCLFLWFKPDSRQAGSQPGRGCTEHLITLTLWIDYAKHKKKKLYLVFVNSSKVFPPFCTALSPGSIGLAPIETANAMYMRSVRTLFGVRKTTAGDLCLIEAGLPSQKKTLDDPLMFTLERCRTANTPCARYIRSLDQHDYDHEDQILKEKARTSTRTKYRSYCNPMNPELKKHEIYTDINVKEYARLTTTRFRLSSHNLAIECGRWLRKRPEKRV